MKTHILFIYLGAVGLSPASVLMLDFGPSPGAGQGGLSSSPYHSLYPTTGTSWNLIGTADVAAGSLLYDDGSAASTIGVSSGFSTTGTAITLSTTPGNSFLGSATYNSGIYAGTNPPSRTAIFNTTSNSNLGIQVTGLAAGIYEVFLHTRNTNGSTNYNQNNFVAAGASGNFDFGLYASQSLSFSGSNSTAAWVAEGGVGENYTRFEITVATGQAINIGITGTGGETRGFLNTLQIAPIPEPSSALLISCSLLPIFCRRRRTI